MWYFNLFCTDFCMGEKSDLGRKNVILEFLNWGEFGHWDIFEK